MQIANYNIAQEIWEHLYEKSNLAIRYKLKSDVRDLKRNNMTIHKFYSAMTNLWDQLTLMESAELKVVKAYTFQREEQNLVQLLMALYIMTLRGFMEVFYITLLFQVLIQ
ncbi:hypothetical protein QL285_011314 [Trifolium repens]|nr:hypothetical protein QL285_011314 [Trifolium repens]